MRNRYNKELGNYIKKNSEFFTLKELSFLIEKEFGIKKSPKALEMFLLRHNIKNKNPRQKISREVKEYIKENYRKISNNEMSKYIFEKYNIKMTPHYIRTEASRNHYAKPKKEIIYSDEINKYIRENALKYNTTQLSDKIFEKFGRKITPKGIECYYKKHKIKHFGKLT